MVEKKTLVSIITVVYNGAETIRQTIESVKEQSYHDIEYIVIDGNSKDGTQEIVMKYKDVVTCFISEADNGLYDAMNKGIRLAKGEIIGIINSDDWYEKDAVEKVVNYFDRNNVDVVYGRIFKVDRNGKIEANHVLPISTMWYQMAIPHPSVFIKRSVYDKYGLFDLNYKFSADYELILRLYSNQVRFGFVNEFLTYFRQGGLSQINIETGKRETYEIACRYIEKCEFKKEILPILQEIGKWIEFEDELKYNPSKIKSILNNYFETNIVKLVVFGTGIWGERCYQALQYTDIEVDFFLDNNEKKEGQMLFGKVIKKPGNLETLKPYILIAVKNNVNEIKNQLQSLKIDRYVTIKELMNMYLSK